MICLYFDMKPTYHTMVFYEEILPLFRDEGIDIPRIADFYIRRWVVLDASKQQIVLTSMSKSETLLSVARAYEEGEIELVISNRCIGQRTAIIDITGLFTCCVVRIEEIVIMDGGGDHGIGCHDGVHGCAFVCVGVGDTPVYIEGVHTARQKTIVCAYPVFIALPQPPARKGLAAFSLIGYYNAVKEIPVRALLRHSPNHILTTSAFSFRIANVTQAPG